MKRAKIQDVVQEKRKNGRRSLMMRLTKEDVARLEGEVLIGVGKTDFTFSTQPMVKKPISDKVLQQHSKLGCVDTKMMLNLFIDEQVPFISMSKGKVANTFHIHMKEIHTDFLRKLNVPYCIKFNFGPRFKNSLLLIIQDSHKI